MIGASSSHPMWSMAHVQGGGGGWDDAAISRMVDPDALKIAAAVTRLRVDADKRDAAGREITKARPAWIDPAELIGIAVEKFGMTLDEAPYFDLAIPRAETLVVVHAKLGTRPDQPDSPSAYAVCALNGAPIVRRMAEIKEATVGGGEIVTDQEQVAPESVTVERRGKPTRGKWPWGSYCLVNYHPTPSSVMTERAEWLVWRLALDWLTKELAGLERIAVTPCALPLRPWHE